jgi:hypothetical protein
MVAIQAPLMSWMNGRAATGIGRLLLAWARGRRPRPIESGSAGRGRVARPRGRPGLEARGSDASGCGGELWRAARCSVAQRRGLCAQGVQSDVQGVARLGACGSVGAGAWAARERCEGREGERFGEREGHSRGGSLEGAAAGSQPGARLGLGKWALVGLG